VLSNRGGGVILTSGQNSGEILSLSQAQQQTSTGVLSQRRALEQLDEENHKIPTYRTQHLGHPVGFGRTNQMRLNPQSSFNVSKQDIHSHRPLPNADSQSMLSHPQQLSGEGDHKR